MPLLNLIFLALATTSSVFFAISSILILESVTFASIISWIITASLTYYFVNKYKKVTLIDKELAIKKSEEKQSESTDDLANRSKLKNSNNQKYTTIVIFLVWALAIYALPQLYFGPHHNIFIPSQSVRQTFGPLTIMLTIAFCGYIFGKKTNRDRMKSRSGKSLVFFYMLTITPVIMLFLYTITELAIPKLLNSLTGGESTLPYIAVKDTDTSKVSGRRITQAYCVEIRNAGGLKIARAFCNLEKEDYDRLPTNWPVRMKFHGTASYFGFEIDGYDPDFEQLKHNQF